MFLTVTQIIAHRGASKFAPENTLAAFKLAEKMGADGIELDIHLTKDQIPVIIHDEDIKRTTNGRGFVQKYTYKELQQFDAGSWFSERFSDERILSREEFFAWILPKDFFVNIEMKTKVIKYPNIEKIVFQLIREYGLENRVIISSFNPHTLYRMRELHPNIELALLSKIAFRNIQQYLSDTGANVMHIKSRLLSSRMVQAMNQHDIPFRVYTVNRRSTFKQSVDKNASGIITDRPDLFSMSLTDHQKAKKLDKS